MTPRQIRESANAPWPLEAGDEIVFDGYTATVISIDYAPESGTPSGASGDPESTAGFTPPLPDSGDLEQP